MTEFYCKLFNIFKSLNNLPIKVFKTNYGSNYNCLPLVFLCGGDRSIYDSRKKLMRIIKKDKSNQVIVAENLTKLTCGLDLLSFERILEAVSKAIIIPVESYGTACEFGAFTYSTKNPKEIAIINKDHSKSGSFIIDGPVALLKENSSESVLFAEYSNNGTSLCVNDDIKKINKLKLMTDKKVLRKYYDNNVKNEDLVIKDLGTFLFCLLDLCYFVGYCNPKIAIKYFCIIHNKNRICFSCNGFDKDDKHVVKVIESFLSIMTGIKILKKEKEFWFPNLTSSFDKKQVGSLLFNKTFLDSKYYSKYFISFRNLLKIS